MDNDEKLCSNNSDANAAVNKYIKKTIKDTRRRCLVFCLDRRPSSVSRAEK